MRKYGACERTFFKRWEVKRKILYDFKCLEMGKGKYMISTLWKNTGITIAKDMLARSVVRTTECVIQSLLFAGGWGWRGVRGESPGTFELLFETICLGETVIELFILHMVLKSSVPLSYRPVFPLILSAHPRRSKFLPNVNVDMTTCYSLISDPKSGHSFPPLSLKKS